MATQIKTIKQKITSISNIKKITKTMEMVSIAKMKKTVSASVASREYSKYAMEILQTIASAKKTKHRFLEMGKGNKVLLLIVASNKGLCGSYNMNISKTVQKYRRARSQFEFEVITIGKQAERIARRNNFKIVASFHEFGEEITADETSVLQKMILDEFSKDGKYRKVAVVYTEFVKQLSYKAIVRQLLPISLSKVKDILEDHVPHVETDKGKQTALWLFEPSEERVLNKIIPDLLNDTLLQVMLEALASEHSSRMMAMKNATENATELVADLLLTYNRARQSNITQEVAEIIAGAEALNKN